MRNGKIAKLPASVRDELNERLEKGESGTIILEWLNEQPTLGELRGEGEDKTVINKQNLSQWRRGGFQEWQLQKEVLEAGVGTEELGGVIDLPRFAANLLAKLAGYYTLLFHGWDGKPNKEIEARGRVLRGFLRDSMLLQRGAGEVDKLNEELRGRQRRRDSILGGGDTLRDVLAVLGEMRRQKYEAARAEAGMAEGGAGKGMETGAGTEDELPQENAKEHERMEGEDSVTGRDESELVKAGQGGAQPAVGLDEGTEADGGGATAGGTEGELPQKNTKEHKSMEDADSLLGRHESGLAGGHRSGGTPSQATGTVTLPGTGDGSPEKSELVKAGQGESHLTVGLDDSGETGAGTKTELPQENAGNAKE